MWSSAKTLEGVSHVKIGAKSDELILVLKPQADPEMFITTICFKINKVHEFNFYSIIKNVLTENRLSWEQALNEIITRKELVIQLPSFLSPHNITLYHVGKKGLKITYPIQQ